MTRFLKCFAKDKRKSALRCLQNWAKCGPKCSPALSLQNSKIQSAVLSRKRPATVQSSDRRPTVQSAPTKKGDKTFLSLKLAPIFWRSDKLFWKKIDRFFKTMKECGDKEAGRVQRQAIKKRQNCCERVRWQTVWENVRVQQSGSAATLQRWRSRVIGKCKEQSRDKWELLWNKSKCSYMKNALWVSDRVESSQCSNATAKCSNATWKCSDKTVKSQSATSQRKKSAAKVQSTMKEATKQHFKSNFTATTEKVQQRRDFNKVQRCFFQRQQFHQSATVATIPFQSALVKPWNTGRKSPQTTFFWRAKTCSKK